MDPISASARTSRKLVEYQKLIVSLLDTARKTDVEYLISIKMDPFSASACKIVEYQVDQRFHSQVDYVSNPLSINRVSCQGRLLLLLVEYAIVIKYQSCIIQSSLQEPPPHRRQLPLLLSIEFILFVVARPYGLVSQTR